MTPGPLPAPGPLPLADSAQPGRPRSWLCCGGGGHLHLLPQGDGGNDNDQHWSPWHHAGHPLHTRVHRVRGDLLTRYGDHMSSLSICWQFSLLSVRPAQRCLLPGQLHWTHPGRAHLPEGNQGYNSLSKRWNNVSQIGFCWSSVVIQELTAFMVIVNILERWRTSSQSTTPVADEENNNDK